jgi:hypothetical protein
VITKIGPHAIDNQGYIDVRPGLRMRYGYFVPLLAGEGHVPLTVVRGGETLEVQAPVLREAERLVPMLKDKYPEYFIYGPLTFTVATQEHVGAVGARGLAALAAFDSPLIKRFSEKPAVPGEELVVIATRNFPHPLTKGYEDRVMGVVESVNGQAVRNLRHLAELLRDSQEEYLIFDIAGRGESFVFTRTAMRDSTEDILVDEGIRYQASESLRDIWED